jgi:hypothetical protein
VLVDFVGSLVGFRPCSRVFGLEVHNFAKIEMASEPCMARLFSFLIYFQIWLYLSYGIIAILATS